MLNEKKAQSAFEFLIIASFILFVFVAFFFAIQSDIAEKSRERKALIMKKMALSIQDEINLATESRDGYLRQFRLPTSIEGITYMINPTTSIEPWKETYEFLYINSSNNKYNLGIPVQNYTGTIGSGINTIRKTNGIVIISNG